MSKGKMESFDLKSHLRLTSQKCRAAWEGGNAVAKKKKSLH